MHVYDIIGLLLGHMIPAVFLQGTQIGVLRALTNNVGQRGMLPITDGRIPDNEDCMPFRLSAAYALCQRRVWTEPLFECSGKMIVFLPFSSFIPSPHPFPPFLLSPPPTFFCSPFLLALLSCLSPFSPSLRVLLHRGPVRCGSTSSISTRCVSLSHVSLSVLYALPPIGGRV